MLEPTPTVDLPVVDLFPSPTNPRGDIPLKPTEDIKELAESIRTRGVETELVVRPRGDGLYEVVCGHRRRVASILAGVEKVPCKVRSLTDAEATELQLVELAHSQAVDPLGEAQTYRALLKTAGTPEAVAQKVGKSRRHVLGRLMLATVHATALQQYREGRFSLGALQAVAALDPAQQEKAAQGIPDYELVDEKEARVWIERHILLELKNAQFDTADATLPGGACAACPKRSGSQPDLFGVITDKTDLCTDPVCWKKKGDQTWERKCQEAKDAGKAVLTQAETKQVFTEDPYGYQAPKVKKGSGYVDLAEKAPDDPKGRTYAQLLGKKAVAGLEVAVARDGKGTTHELVKVDKTVKQVLKEKLPAPEQKASSKAPEKKPKGPPQASGASIVKVLYRLGAEQMKAKPGTLWPVEASWFRKLLGYVIGFGIDSEDVLSVALGVENKKIDDELDRIHAHGYQAALLCIACALPDTERTWWSNTALAEACDLLGLDPKAVEKEALQAEAAAPEKEEPPPAKGKKSDDVRECLSCGCTEERACPEGCSWIPGATKDGKHADICTSCSEYADQDKPAKKAKSKKAATNG